MIRVRLVGVTAMPEPPRLRAVNASDGDPLERDGLALVYAALERTRTDLGLERLTVAVDDARLGRQLLTAPRVELPAPLDPGSGWVAEPPLDGGGGEVDIVRALCRLALRTAAVDDAAATPFDRVELALRGLDAIEAVALDADHDVLRVQAVAGTAHDDVAGRSLAIVKAQLDRSVVVELVRVGAGAPAGKATEPIEWAPAAPVEVLAVRTDHEHAELEVHLRGGDVRTVGRAPVSRGLMGAAEATLAAWHGRPGAPLRTVAWARTVETSADARFVVAVALEDARLVTVAHGIAEGPNPLEAAVRATVDALAR